MKRAYLVLLVLLLAAAGSSGCAAVGLTLVGVGASTGSSYIMDSIYHKTFAASEEGPRPPRGKHHRDGVAAPRGADARTQDESDGRRRAQTARSRHQVRRRAASGGNQAGRTCGQEHLGEGQGWGQRIRLQGG